MDYKTLGDQVAKTDSVNREVLPGRVAHADADFYCYDCAKIDEPIGENFRILKDTVEARRKLAGASRIVSHVTMGLKSGRTEMATVKPYQEKRDNRCPEVKARVMALRELLGKWLTPTNSGVIHLDQEADDGMTQAHLKDKAELGLQKSVLMSGDKDLWMVEGLHCDEVTGELYNVVGYGLVRFKEVGNKSPKLVGTGTNWFWHQMLMGDSADNIPGLPKLSGRLANRYLPTKAFNPNRPDLLCGQAKAVAVLKHCTTDLEALIAVHECYNDWYGTSGTTMMFEQAYLLWMRREKNPLDVLDYWKSLGFSYTLTSLQSKAIRDYEAKVRQQNEQADSA